MKNKNKKELTFSDYEYIASTLAIARTTMGEVFSVIDKYHTSGSKQVNGYIEKSLGLIYKACWEMESEILNKYPKLDDNYLKMFHSYLDRKPYNNVERIVRKHAFDLLRIFITKWETAGGELNISQI